MKGVWLGGVLMLSGALLYWGQDSEGTETHVRSRNAGPTVMIRPERFELGPQPVGSRHRISFEVTNVTEQPVTFGPIQASCGCLEARISPPRIGPGESAMITAIQEVQSEGETTASLHLPVSTGVQEGGAMAAVSMSGIVQDVLWPELVNLGRFSGAGPDEPARWVYQTPGDEAPVMPQLEVLGDFSVRPSAKREPGVAACGIEGLVEARDGLFGALEGTVQVRTPGGDGPTSRLVGERVPDGYRGEWPNCVLGFGTQNLGLEDTLFFPGVTFRGESSSSAASDGPSVRYESVDGGSVVHVSCAPDLAVDLQRGVIQLDSSVGTVQLRWFFMP